MDGKSGTTLMLFGLAGVAAERVLLVGLGSESEFGDRRSTARRCATAVRARLPTPAPPSCVLCFGELPVKGARRGVARAPGGARRRRRALPLRRDEEQEVAAARARQSWCSHLQRQDGREPPRRRGIARRHGDRRRHRARQGPRQPSRQRLHARLPRRAGERSSRASAKLEVRSARTRGDGEARHGRAALGRAGPRQPPKFIVLAYRRRRRRARSRWCSSARASPSTPAASRSSPRAEMDEMKFDMCGAATRARRHAGGRRARAAAERRRPHPDDREHARRAAPPSRATSSRACPARRWRSSTPTPRAGSSCATRSPMPSASSPRRWSTSRRSPAPA